MRASQIVLGAALMAAGAAPVIAQDVRPSQVRTFVRAFDNGDEDRAALGVVTGSTGKRDTLGLLIESVTPGSPADKAGLQEGYRIAAINGQNLKVAAGDAGEPDMDGLMTRRLARELAKVKAGDEVTLDVYADGGHKTVKVKTAALADIGERRMKMSADDYDNRAVIGLGLGGGGSRRDTLGLLVTSVATDGPADKVGIEEGNRIARIDTVDLRVTADEAVQGALIGAKQRRFTRALEGRKPGDAVTLQVWANGAFKTTKVTLGRAADVYPQRKRGFRFNFDGGEAMMAPMPRVPPMPPMPPMPAVAPRVRVLDGGDYDIDMPRLRIQLRDMQRDVENMSREVSRDAAQRSDMAAVEANMVARRAALAADRANVMALRGTMDSWTAPRRSGRGVFALGAGGGTMSLGGLRMAPVSDGLSSYFGKGSEKGMLLLDVSDGWKPLRAGDVILSVNGKAVRDGDAMHLSLDSGQDNAFVVLRKGVRTTVQVKAH